MLTVPKLATDGDLYQFELEPGVWAAVGRVEDHTSKLFSDEAASISRAVASRRFEFSTGRFLARLALQRCGSPPRAILQNAFRRPIWPDGFVGSISHTRELAFALASRKDAPFQGVGVDLEREMRVSGGLERLVLTRQELDRLQGTIPETATWIFSAKEAVFKAVNPIVGLMIDFNEVEICVDPYRQSFSATYVGKDLRNKLIDSGKGSFTRHSGHILSRFVILPGS